MKETRDRNKATESGAPGQVEKALLDRIRWLEEQNSVLQDKLDMIYAILAPDYEELPEGESQESDATGFIQIEGSGPGGSSGD
jgi:hypothetical protein